MVARITFREVINMGFSISSLVDTVKHGTPEQRLNLTLFPLFMECKTAVSYLLLDEALQRRVLVVMEVGEGGLVNAVMVENKSEQAVLILDGEELVGAKQNRMVNATLLVPPKSKIRVPVSCVERGRWQYGARTFEQTGIFGYATLRRQKAAQVGSSLRQGMAFTADQGAIWEEIDRKQARMHAHSATDAVHDIYVGFEEKLREYVEGLSPTDGQSGVAAFINGRFSCLDLFAPPDTLAKVWPKLIRSYAMEALELAQTKDGRLTANMDQVLDAIKRMECQEYPSVGRGTDIRLRGKGLVGAGLVDEGQLLHLCVFGATDSEHETNETPMARPSRRRVRVW
ncbi:MAG: hypothetical protein NUW12_11550 [Firmicutes bacterium]|jgi:hypothetical protein|nr:hypothetical protein [Bacillota bacterium]MDH7496629.1 hypothetical protein [Bacillota bacterium]